MNISLENIALHPLRVSDSDIIINQSAHQLENTAYTEALVTNLFGTCVGKGKAVAEFTDSSLFEKGLSAVSNNDCNFIDFSNQIAKVMQEEMNKYALLDVEGYLVVSQFVSECKEYFMLTAIRSNSAMTADDSGIGAIRYLDMSTVTLCAFVNVTEYQLNPQAGQYISILKNRAGRKNVDFFLDVLGADISVDVINQNRLLLAAVTEFASASSLDKSETDELKKSAYDYCNDQASCGQDVSVTELSEEMENISGASFDDFIAEQDYGLAEKFPAQLNTLKALKTASYRSSGISLSFDLKLLGERILLDEGLDQLVIKGIPPQLKKQLLVKEG